MCKYLHCNTLRWRIGIPIETWKFHVLGKAIQRCLGSRYQREHPEMAEWSPKNSPGNDIRFNEVTLLTLSSWPWATTGRLRQGHIVPSISDCLGGQ